MTIFNEETDLDFLCKSALSSLVLGRSPLLPPSVGDNYRVADASTRKYQPLGTVRGRIMD